MKKLFIISISLFCCTAVFAQLKVVASNRAYLGKSGCFLNGPDPEDYSGSDIPWGYMVVPISEGILNVRGAVSAAAKGSEYTFKSTPITYTSGFAWTATPTFYVTAEGKTYSKLGYIQSSDSINKNNISSLSAALPRINALRGVVFDYRSDKDAQSPSLSRSAISTPQDSISMQQEKEKDRKRIGLIAQEVEKVLPEVVRTLPDGSKGIMYGDIVAVLVEGMKEMQDTIASLRRELNEVKSALNTQEITNAPSLQPDNEDNGMPNQALGQGEAELYQNTPNPFNQETEIGYKLSNHTNSASICIYNLNGQQLKKYALSTASRTGKVTISASEFSAGMYIYALVINNQVIDSKRMTLTD